VRDLLGIGLGLADQRRQSLAQRCCGGLVEAEVDLTGIDQVLAPETADINAVPPVAVEREARDGQGLARWAQVFLTQSLPRPEA
jgi:hypothetical protein